MSLRRTALSVVFAAEIGSCLAPIPAGAATYYVDNSSLSASDVNAGTSEAGAWKTIARVNNQTLQPGDSVLFKTGTTYTGNLSIRWSGTPSAPITIATYGTGGPAVIRNPGTWTIGVTIDADWVKISGFLLRDIHEAGVRIARGRAHNVVERCEMTAVGIGVEILGPSNVIRNNYAHDLTMVTNTVGGNDDYGAVGYWIEGPGNELAYNRCVRCRAPSYDYGFDGGFMEIYGNGDNTVAHYNWGQDCNAFFEVGGQPGSAKNVTIAYNVSINNGGYFGGVHVSGSFVSTLLNLRLENNTIVDVKYASPNLVWFSADPGQANVLFRNNIVMVDQVRAVFSTAVTRANNLYYFMSGQGQLVVGSTALAMGERTGNPMFTDLSGFNVRLQGTSPAIDRGLLLGYARDFDHGTVPVGAAPDLGAFEFTGPSSDVAPLPPSGLRVF